MDKKDRAAVTSGLDIHSCLQFLLEQFGQFLLPNTTPRVPLMQLNETVKSVSDNCFMILDFVLSNHKILIYLVSVANNVFGNCQG